MLRRSSPDITVPLKVARKVSELSTGRLVTELIRYVHSMAEGTAIYENNADPVALDHLDDNMIYVKAITNELRERRGDAAYVPAVPEHVQDLVERFNRRQARAEAATPRFDSREMVRLDIREPLL